MESQNNRLLDIYGYAHSIHDVSLALERLVVATEEMYRFSPKERDAINGNCWAIYCLFNWIREQLQLIMAAAEGKDIPKEGGEQVA